MKKIFLYACCLFLAVFGLYQINRTVLAEQSGSSPESGADSRIKTAYDWLVAKGANYGTTDAADWDSAVTYPWGTYLNLIMESAVWEPDGDLAVGDVSPGKTFYSGNNDRTQKTGTGTIYSNQSLVEWDDYKTGDSTAEEAVWTNTAGTATAGVWKDTRTGLYWSNSRGQFDNIFPDTTHTACPFFALSDRGAYDGLDADCGNSINACGILSLDADGDAVAETDWYLPSQKELQQAYIDGAYNQNSTWATTSNFWSSAEYSSNPAYAWYVDLYYGITRLYTKVTATTYVRCVRRD
ncbi:DUF1566 domain-containing protein [Patescibacteria group bacterium]|nr:DUF1566 domain-containing protein [Patescibacteria group bacterium]